MYTSKVKEYNTLVEKSNEVIFQQITESSKNRNNRLKIENNKVYLTVQSTFDEVPCRKCGGPTKSKGYAEEREIRHYQ